MNQTARRRRNGGGARPNFEGPNSGRGFPRPLSITPLRRTARADDTHFVTFNLFRTKEPGAFNRLLQRHYGKTWWEMSPAEHQSSPGDYEAQVSIGALPAHNHEHFSPGDVGVGVLRRQLEEAVRAVAEGRDPPGIIFDEKDAVIETSKLAIPTITSLE